MAKIQIIAAMTMDGFLPKADESLMQWVMNDAKGFPYWHEHSVYRLMPHYPLLDLIAEAGDPDGEEPSDEEMSSAQISLEGMEFSFYDIRPVLLESYERVRRGRFSLLS